MRALTSSDVVATQSCLTNFLGRKIKSVFLQRKIILPSSKSEKTGLSWTGGESRVESLGNKNNGENRCPQGAVSEGLLVTSVSGRQCCPLGTRLCLPGPPFSERTDTLLLNLPRALS